MRNILMTHKKTHTTTDGRTLNSPNANTWHLLRVDKQIMGVLRTLTLK